MDKDLLAGIFLAYVVIVDLLAFYSVRKYAREDAPV